MKNLILLFVFVVGGNLLLAQNAKPLTSGDAELDKAIKNVNVYGRKNPEQFKQSLIAKYDIKETESIDKYTPGDLMMGFATAKELNKDASLVYKTYDDNRNKMQGWEETLKELGIKQNSKTFENIKSVLVAGLN